MRDIIQIKIIDLQEINYFPTQNSLKIAFKASSDTVLPVSSDSFDIASFTEIANNS